MKYFQNSAIGPILKELTLKSDKYHSKLNFVFNVCLFTNIEHKINLLSFPTLKASQKGTNNRHDVKFIFIVH